MPPPFIHPLAPAVLLTRPAVTKVSLPSQALPPPWQSAPLAVPSSFVPVWLLVDPRSTPFSS
jgi:hypothetical protein